MCRGEGEGSNSLPRRCTSHGDANHPDAAGQGPLTLARTAVRRGHVPRKAFGFDGAAGKGTPVFRPAQRPTGSRNCVAPIGQKRGDGLERRPLGSSPGGARHARERETCAGDVGPCQRECRTTFSCGRGERADPIMWVSPGGAGLPRPDRSGGGPPGLRSCPGPCFRVSEPAVAPISRPTSGVELLGLHRHRRLEQRHVVLEADRTPEAAEPGLEDSEVAGIAAAPEDALLVAGSRRRDCGPPPEVDAHPAGRSSRFAGPLQHHAFPTEADHRGEPRADVRYFLSSEPSKIDEGRKESYQKRNHGSADHPRLRPIRRPFRKGPPQRPG